MIVSNTYQIKCLREGGKILSDVLKSIKERVETGITTLKLDFIAEEKIRRSGCRPSFLGYRPRGANREYPATLCVSINEEIVHGLPSSRKLKNGDIVGLDIGLIYKGFYLDMAETVSIGSIDPNVDKLLKITKKALDIGIKAAVIGNTIGDIGHYIDGVGRRAGYEPIRELGGHGVGLAVHEKPFIPNFGKKGSGEKIKNGMVLALEPMFSLGSNKIRQSEDGFTYITKDGSISAHFEHTILVTENGPEVLTQYTP